MPTKTAFVAAFLALSSSCLAQETDNIGHQRHLHKQNLPHSHDPNGQLRIITTRQSPVELPMPLEDDAFTFVVFGDRTGGPAEGVSVLADAVRDTNLLEPDFVITVGDLINGYNQTDEWMVQMNEYKTIMGELLCPWFPVAGNHDVYWRGPDKPQGEHEASYEIHFGPLWYAFTHKNSGFIVLYTDEGDPATGEKNFNKPASHTMSDDQKNWLADTLSRFSTLDHVFLFCHHPRWIGGSNYANSWDHVHDMLVDAGNVTAVFGGHIHRMRSDPKDGIEYITLATVGGGQSAKVPQAGYLHHFNTVTVRKNQIALASIPVGEVMDVREITGTLSAETAQLADSRPRITGQITVEPDGSARGEIVAALSNPTSRPIDVMLTIESDDNWWVPFPDHNHRTIAPGESASFTFRVDRFGGIINERFRAADLVTSIEYLAPGHRYAIPASRTPLPMRVDLPEPSIPEDERVLALDGRGYLSIPAADIQLPDGPFTLECWFNADAFADRNGLINKTEVSEYGFFVNRGEPAFMVNFAGRYAEVKGKPADLKPNTWHHIAGVFDGAEVRLYIDGSLVGRTPATGKRTTNPLPLLIGADVTADARPTSNFKGRIDAVHLSTIARYTDTFTPTRRPHADEHTFLLLNMDAQIGTWLYDESPRATHPLVHQGATISPN